MLVPQQGRPAQHTNPTSISAVRGEERVEWKISLLDVHRRKELKWIDSDGFNGVEVRNFFRLTDSVGFSAKVTIHGRMARTNHHNTVTVATQGDQDW